MPLCEDCGTIAYLCIDCALCFSCCPFDGVLCREGRDHHAEGDANNTGYCCDCFSCSICDDNQCLWLDENSLDDDDGLPKAKSGCRHPESPSKRIKSVD